MKDTSWEKVAPWYAEYLASAESYHATVISPNLLRFMDIKAGDTILDLACGAGYFTRQFAGLGASVYGTDISPSLIARAASAAPSAKLFVSSSDALTNVLSHSIDKIAIVLAIQNIQKVKETFVECERVLKPGGRLFVVMNHPVIRIPKGSSWGFDEKDGVMYRRLDSYLSEKTLSIDAHPGLSAKGVKAKTTVSFHRPLQYYFKLLSSAGFAVSRLEEWISPKNSQKGPRQKEEDRTRKEFPLFLAMEIRRI